MVDILPFLIERMPVCVVDYCYLRTTILATVTNLLRWNHWGKEESTSSSLWEYTIDLRKLEKLWYMEWAALEAS